MPNRSETWKHGWVHRSKAGRPTYFIRERRGGRLFEVSTGASTEDGAFKQYDRFDKDPDAYVADMAAGGVWLTFELGKAYIDHCRAPESAGGKGNSQHWLNEKGRCLDWWRERIGTRDLRRLQKADLDAMLEPKGKRVPGYAHKVEVVKDFFGWLVEKEGFPHSADPTVGLLVPQARPGLRKKQRKAFTREQHKRLVAQVAAPYRWALQVLAGTGWHLSEVRRFARAGSIEPVPEHMRDGTSAVAVLVTPMHKSGDEHRTAVMPETLAAAEQLLKHGGLSESRLYKAVRAGCAAAKPPIDPIIDPGQYRHAVATWAIERGAAPAAVAAFLGHRSPATTKRFYARHAVPPPVPTLAS